MRIVEVNTKKKYKVYIGNNVLEELFTSKDFTKDLSGSKLLIVTDSEVDSFYGINSVKKQEKLFFNTGSSALHVTTHSNCICDEEYSGMGTIIKSLENLNVECFKYIIPSGEKSKSTTELVNLLEYMAKMHFTRKDYIISFGGGVVGDLSGLAAALYMRGISYIQIPTTLLAMVDSSVGGKTAVNLESGKNLMGAFYQPEFVVCDYSLLRTLPKDVFADGMAEVIKYAFIYEPRILKLIEEGVKENLEEIIACCVRVKSKFVSEDEFDFGSRQLLNFGHTIGHAIEAASKYTISHGRAVAIGMTKITKACVDKGICPKECLEKLEEALLTSGIDLEYIKDIKKKSEDDDTEGTSGKDFSINEFSSQVLYEWVLSDKKRSVDYINLVIPKQIGKCELLKVSYEELIDFF